MLKKVISSDNSTESKEGAETYPSYSSYTSPTPRRNLKPASTKPKTPSQPIPINISSTSRLEGRGRNIIISVFNSNESTPREGFNHSPGVDKIHQLYSTPREEFRNIHDLGVKISCYR